MREGLVSYSHDRMQDGGQGAFRVAKSMLQSMFRRSTTAGATHSTFALRDSNPTSQVCIPTPKPCSEWSGCG